MRKLLNIELVKLLNYTSFKVLLGLHLALFSLVIFVSSQINITVPGFDTTNMFRFPHVWSYFSWVASWFNLLLAILVIMVTGNEFSFRTFRQHVIDGLSRLELLKGKVLVILLIAAYSFMLVLVSGLIYGMIYSTGSAAIFDGLGSLLIYFLQTVAFMVIGLLLAVLLKGTALPIILFILIRFPVEPVMRSFFPHSVRPFFPMKSVGNLTPMPEFLSITSENTYETTGGGNALSLTEIGIVSEGLPLHFRIAVVAGYILLFLFLTGLLLKKRSL